MEQLREKIDLTREAVWYNTNDVKRIYEKLDGLNDRVLKLEAQFKAKESGVVVANPASGVSGGSIFGGAGFGPKY